jgi:outer membrane protein assembly factor BamB
LWGIAALVLIFVSLVGYQYGNRVRYRADPSLLRDLSFASLDPNAEATSQLNDAVRLAERPLLANPRGDWPQWRGPNRDGLSTETGLRTDWPKEGPKVLWEAPLGGGYGCPAVVGKRVVTLTQERDDEAVVCRDTETGRELWQLRYPCKYLNDFGPGPRATPTVDGDFVYTVGATGILHCLKLETGDKVWRHNLLEEFHAPNLRWGVSFSPLVEGDLLLTMPGGPGGDSLAAFHKKTGELVWKTGSDPAGYGSPVACTAAGVRQVLFFTGTGLVSVAPDSGKVYWSFPWETSFGCNVATPIVRGDYVFLSSGYGKGCALLKVEAKDGGALGARAVYETNQMCNHFASSVLYMDHLYGFNESTLTCMEFRTGQVVWTERGFKKGSLLIADGHLIILGENGRLALAEATPAGYREKAAFRPFRTKCWTVPVLAQGRLYIRDEERLLCLDVKK